MFGYRVPAADQAMLISGGRRARSGVPFRVVVGHGAFVNPFIRRVGMLSLAMREAEVAGDVRHRAGDLGERPRDHRVQGGERRSRASSTRVSGSCPTRIRCRVLTGRIFAGHLRSIVGSMTVEEIVTERQKLATEVLDGSKGEMAKIGLTVDSLQIQSIDDMGTGYIDAMAAPHVSAIQRQAKIAQAQADQAAAEAQQASQRKQAEYARQTAVVQAAVQGARWTRRRPRRLRPVRWRRRRRSRRCSPMQTKLAERNAELRQQQLVAEVVKPAEAEAERVRTLAQADAERTKILAEAAASLRPGCAGPDADRPAAADRQGGGGRPGWRQHQRAERSRRPERDRRGAGRPGHEHPGLGEGEPGDGGQAARAWPARRRAAPGRVRGRAARGGPGGRGAAPGQSR